jgi:membrane associated rhomboid family serine protease
MFVFPIRTDRRLQHTPWVNWTLIAANVAVFMLTNRGMDRAGMDPYILNPWNPTLVQFLSYQFLHANWMHLLGNMLFLYVFGNSVEDRLGKVGYLAFYLAGGVLAGLGHAAVENAPVLGASGSVAAVSGAYLALFPMSNVTLFYWVFFIGFFEVSSLLVICFYIGSNLLYHVLGFPGVAYLAHLAGYAAGFAVGMGLLWLRLLPREPYDLLSMLEHRRRRAQFRAMTRKGYHPWEGAKAADPVAGDADQTPTDPAKAELMRVRAAIADALAAHNMPEAARLYDQLLRTDGSQVLGQQAQLDVANQLMSEGRHESAAKAYELFLGTYGRYPQREQVELILGLICLRYLNRRQRARELLASAAARLHDPDQRSLAQRMLAEIE